MSEFIHHPQPPEVESEIFPKYYGLSSEDFSPERAPSNPLTYHEGDLVTRENFCSMLILSFAKSRGDSAAQTAFFKNLHSTAHFDCRGTLMAFQIKGWDSFSDAEKDLFVNAYLRVKKHLTQEEREKINQRMAAELDRVSENLLKVF